MMIRVCTGALALLVAGCGSSPATRYYTLTPVRPPGKTVDSGEPIRIGRVNILARLDRDSLVERSGSGALKIIDSDRWAGPLDAMIRSTVAEELRDRLSSDEVYLPGDYIPAGPSRFINLNIL